MEKAFAAFFILFFVAMVVLFGVLTEYAPPDMRQLRYSFFTDVHVMIFVGFGFLMCFLARGGFTATCHAFVVAAYAILWALLNRGFWMRAVKHDPVWDKLKLSAVELIGADFCAAAVLISFGALLGRVTASQLLMLCLIEVVVYCINEAIIIERLGIADIGGSMVIHMFGAYFGLACSFVLEKLRPVKNAMVETAKVGSRVTDTVAMVGTLFLFIYWPSFNAALADPMSQDRAVINTYLSIASSVIAAFLLNVLLHQNGRVSMEVMQNSTIAGGVAMGAAADMIVNPFGAMIIGFVAGAVSAFGYMHISETLEAKLGLRDTCGVHNLHGMPGLIGGIAAAIAAGARQRGSYRGTMDAVFLQARTSEDQAGMQMAGIGISLGFALVGGAIAGAVLSQMPSLPEYFDDRHEYVLPNGRPITPRELAAAGTEMHPTTTQPTHTSASDPHA